MFMDNKSLMTAKACDEKTKDIKLIKIDKVSLYPNGY